MMRQWSKLGKNTLLFAGSITNENVLNKFDKKIYLFLKFLLFIQRQ